jgi:hypothetical protein
VSYRGPRCITAATRRPQPSRDLPAASRPPTVSDQSPNSRQSLKNGRGNLAARNVDQLAAIVRNRLKRIQYRPGLTASIPRLLAVADSGAFRHS